MSITRKLKSPFNEEKLKDYLYTLERLNTRGLSVIQAMLYQDKQGIIIKDFSFSDSIDDVSLRNLMFERKFDHKTKKIKAILRVCYEVTNSHNDREIVWFDADLLYYKDDKDLKTRVQKYIDMMTAPVLEKRKEHDLEKLETLMKKYPKETLQIQKKKR